MDDRDRFERLYLAYAGVVWSYGRRRLDAGEADDLVAEVFLVVWRRLDEIPSDPLPWLLGVARRVAANRRRGERRSAALISRLQDEARVRAGVVEDDLDARTIRALSTLSESDQELLLLVAWEGLNRVQLARLLGLRTGALAVRLHRARRRFADALEKEDAGAEASSARSPAMEVR